MARLARPWDRGAFSKGVGDVFDRFRGAFRFAARRCAPAKEVGVNAPLFTVSFASSDGVEGHAVIDSLVNGTSSGGVRIVPDLKMDEVRFLASEMTLKYAFCGLPRGGAKCGVRMPAGFSREERLDLLEDVGRRLSAVIQAGIYYPGMDMNCGPDELRAIYRGAGIALGGLTDTSLFTAVFTAEAVTACARAEFAHADGPVTLAVEGFGNVATHLAGMLDPARFSIVAVSTVHGAVHDPSGFDPQNLRTMRGAHGDDLVSHLSGERLEPKERLLSLPVDILVPAARVGSINEDNMHDISARCVVPAANAPCTAEALAALHARGIMVLPGFVCNAGGVLGSSLFDRGVPQMEVEALAAGPYREAVTTLVLRSRELGVQPTELARRVALAHLKTGPGGSDSRLVRVARRLARRVRPVARFLDRNVSAACAKHFQELAREIARLDPHRSAADGGVPAPVAAG